MRPHRRQPTRLPCPWDSPGKNTGVGCHFLLQRMEVKSGSEGAQLCLTLSDPMDCSPPGSSVRGVFQARVLEWGAMAFCIAISSQRTQLCPGAGGRKVSAEGRTFCEASGSNRCVLLALYFEGPLSCYQVWKPFCNQLQYILEDLN